MQTWFFKRVKLTKKVEIHSGIKCMHLQIVFILKTMKCFLAFIDEKINIECVI